MGRRQGEGKETRGREGETGKGRRQEEGKETKGKGRGREKGRLGRQWQKGEIIFSFSPNMREIL